MEDVVLVVVVVGVVVVVVLVTAVVVVEGFTRSHNGRERLESYDILILGYDIVLYFNSGFPNQMY